VGREREGTGEEEHGRGRERSGKERRRGEWRGRKGERGREGEGGARKGGQGKGEGKDDPPPMWAGYGPATVATYMWPIIGWIDLYLC